MTGSGRYVPVAELTAEELEERRAMEREKKRKQWQEHPARERKKSYERSVRSKANRRAKAQAMRDLFDANSVPLGRIRRPMRPRKRAIEPEPGVRLEVWTYTAGAVALALDRTTQTVRMWEKNGILPAATYRDDRQRRLYTQDQMEALVRIFADAKQENVLSWKDSGIPEQIRRAWAELPHGVTKQKLETARRAGR